VDRGDLPPPQAQGIVSNRAGGGLSQLLPRCEGGNGILLTAPLEGARAGAAADGRNTIVWLAAGNRLRDTQML